MEELAAVALGEMGSCLKATEFPQSLQDETVLLMDYICPVTYSLQVPVLLGNSNTYNKTVLSRMKRASCSLGSALYGHRINHCQQPWNPMWTPIQVLAAALLVQLPPNTLEKQGKMMVVSGPLLPTQKTRTRLLAPTSTWHSQGPLGHMVY